MPSAFTSATVNPVTSTARGLSDIEWAERAAARAAGLSGVDIAEVTEVADLKEVSRLLAAIWSTDEDRSPVSADLMRAFSHSGNYVAAARLDGRIVGASVGFLHLAEGSLKLHSHITGIAPEAQGRSIGTALKQHQRMWALARNISTVSWTFDPLVRRNAWFNLMKLGAAITRYHPAFYGAMEDGVNAGDESDRCVAEWRLTPGEAIDAREGVAVPTSGALLASGAAVALEEGPDGEPALHETVAATRLCWVPPDIVALRGTDPDLALRWRRALRSALTDGMQAGLVATSMTRDGCYVLAAPAP